MSADPREGGDVAAGAEHAGLEVNLETSLPRYLPIARATAIFCLGTCFHRSQPVKRLELAVDGVRHRVTVSRMPRPDLFRALHPTLTSEEAAYAERDPRSTRDPELRCYRSGFWATLPIEPRDRPGAIELRAVARLADGATVNTSLGTIEVVEPAESPRYEALAAREAEGLIAICMATFDPDLELFRAQIESIRAQTHQEWICLISDDCSQPDRYAAIESTVSGDDRFVVSRADERLGFYRNFERSLQMAPTEAEFVALCDQDDRWYPEKLDALRRSIGGAQLAYSDQRLVDVDGRVLADTFWQGRRNNYRNLPSLLIANSITGAAMLFRRELLEYALPFPDPPGWQFHDHWLGLVALATGEIAYVDRPLYDYVQHRGGILGQVVVDPGDGPGAHRSGVERVRELRRRFTGWRAAYFCAYLRLEVQAHVLLARCRARLSPGKRRALRRFVASAGSPVGFAWLALRPLRRVIGRNETLGVETQMVQGIIWRRLIALRARRLERPAGAAPDASRPPCGPDSFGQRELRRWRAHPTPRSRST